MYLRPDTIEDAIAALAQSNGRLFAGGTDIMPAYVDRAVTLPFIDISRISELHGISIDRDFIRIGGATTWANIIAENLPPDFRALQEAAREVGSWQIQNAGTLAGNLCNASPAADGVPPLLALNAQVELVSSAGKRILLLSDFILGNRKTALREGELLTAVIVPKSERTAVSRFSKLGSRRYLVISIVMAAVVLETDMNGIITDARIAIGACSAVAQRLPALERELRGQPYSPESADIVSAEHMNSLRPIDDVRGTALYRRDAAQTVVRRALHDCLLDSGHA
ncbi:MAG: FAD binding domain-containing protein [Beijerinckiaceae bacterium]